VSDESLLAAKTVKALEKALDAGANLEAKDEDGNTKLLLCCKSKSGAMSATEAQMALFLIGKGAKITAENDDSEQPLHLAAASGNHEVIEALLKKGAKPTPTKKLGYTPLHYCVDTQAKDSWIWDTLLAAGNPLDHANKWGDTPMLAAQSSHNETAVLYFLGKGANRDVKDSKGKSMVEIATQYKQSKVLAALSGAPAKPAKKR
jgi:ankyrin repeat protein